MTKHMKYGLSFVASLALSFCIAAPALAQEGTLIVPTTAHSTTARLVNVGLGFLFIISIISVLMGGFKYMVAGGSTEKADEARTYIISGIIGLAIVLAMWAVTAYVVTDLLAPTSSVL